MDGLGLNGGILYCISGKVPVSPLRTWLESWMGVSARLIFAGERLSLQHQQSLGGTGVPPASTRMGAEQGVGRGEVAAMVPIPMLGAHQLLPQENATCNIWGNTTDYQSTPAEEDLSRTPHLVRVFVGLILAPG